MSPAGEDEPFELGEIPGRLDRVQIAAFVALDLQLGANGVPDGPGEISEDDAEYTKAYLTSSWFKVLSEYFPPSAFEEEDWLGGDPAAFRVVDQAEGAEGAQIVRERAREGNAEGGVRR